MATIDHMRAALTKGKEMRDLQRKFFKGDRTVIASAKRAEREFDDLTTYALNLDATPAGTAGVIYNSALAGIAQNAAGEEVMTVLIKAIGFVNGTHCPHAGQYLMSADFEYERGRGWMDFTPNPKIAKRFATVGDAMTFWKTPSKTVPYRADGQPNRPLTALSCEIVSMPK